MYINLLTKIKNAQAVNAETIKTPFSNFDLAILEVLEKNKLIEAVSKKGRMPKRVLEVRLKYKNGKGVINGVKLLSRSSRRLYAGYQTLRPVRQGFGITILSTSKGIMDDRTARRGKIGGQLLFVIW